MGLDDLYIHISQPGPSPLSWPLLSTFCSLHLHLLPLFLSLDLAPYLYLSLCLVLCLSEPPVLSN